MDFSSLVLMEKDKETGFIKKELGSFQVDEGALFVTKLYVLEDKVHLLFDTNKDVEEWEYSAIYDLFNKEVFEGRGYEINEELEEYNPSFELVFDYTDDYAETKEKIDECVGLIKQEMESVFKATEGKEAEYTD